MLQVRVQEILTGPQIAHRWSRCICVGTQLVDHLSGPDAINFISHTHTHRYVLATQCYLKINRSYWAKIYEVSAGNVHILLAK